MKNCKIFCKAQTTSRLKKIIQLFPISPSPDKTLLRLWKKKILKEIFRNIQTFCFKMLQECSSWAPRNGAVQYFFWHQTNINTGKFVKSESFLALLWEHIIFNVKWIEVRKIWGTLFERNCIAKCVIFFASFCRLWYFLLENLKLKENSDDVHWNVWTNIITLYPRNNIFKKIIPNMRLWISYI